MIDEMSGLKMEETTLNKYKADLNNQSMQKLQIMQIYIDRDLLWINEKLSKCQEKQSRLQKTMEDYVNDSFDVRYIKQCIEYGCGGGMGWDQIIKDAYREKEEEQKIKLAQELLEKQQEELVKLSVPELIKETPLEKYNKRQQKIMDGTITEEEIAEYLRDLEPYFEKGRQLTLQERQKEQAFAQKEEEEAQEARDFENQTGIFDFQPSNGPEAGYVGIVPCDSSIFDPY